MLIKHCVLGMSGMVLLVAVGTATAGPGRESESSAEVCLSSIRWKENIEPIRNALGKTLRLRGVFFDWKPEYGGQHDIGFIAEEVGKVVPELVEWEVDGESAVGVKYERVSALAVEAIRELNECIERLQDYILKLQAQMEAQANLIAEHETVLSEHGARICALQTQVQTLQTSTVLLQEENVQMKKEIAELRAMIQGLAAQSGTAAAAPAP